MGTAANRGVSVLLPVWRADASSIARAMQSLSLQTHSNLEIVCILNGSDESTRAAVHQACGHESRSRVIELPDAGLPAALNAGLFAARHDLVARMDADDVCHPQRIEQQVEAMSCSPHVAALGCAYEIVDARGARVGVVSPPTEPHAARWRLLVSNPFAHGSMMLRRDAVLSIGGYDTSFARAQDYDLWVRLSSRCRGGGVCALPDLLYTLSRPDPYTAFGATTDQQAHHAATVMARAWQSLAPGDMADIVPMLASLAQRTGDQQGIAEIESMMNLRGPSMASLLAWLWGQWTTPGGNAEACAVARRARVREIANRIRAAGATRLWLWGAGAHTAQVLSNPSDIGLPIAGIVDDRCAGVDRFGYHVASPDALDAGQHVMLSSDWHEDDMWTSSRRVRERGVQVWRLYQHDAIEADRTACRRSA